MRPRKKSRREELIEARETVRRQIEILRNPARGRDFTPLSRQLVADLRATLRELETCLADLGPGER
ncbi:MAG: hypothetical protein ACREEB_06285 [Caulobacteraceae bacterium]